MCFVWFCFYWKWWVILCWQPSSASFCQLCNWCFQTVQRHQHEEQNERRGLPGNVEASRNNHIQGSELRGQPRCDQRVPRRRILHKVPELFVKQSNSASLVSEHISVLSQQWSQQTMKADDDGDVKRPNTRFSDLCFLWTGWILSRICVTRSSKCSKAVKLSLSLLRPCSEVRGMHSSSFFISCQSTLWEGCRGRAGTEL